MEKKGTISIIFLFLLAIVVFRYWPVIRPMIRPCVDGDVRYYTCKDGTQVIEYICKDRKWVLSDEKCPPPTTAPPTTPPPTIIKSPTTTPPIEPSETMLVSSPTPSLQTEKPYIEFIEYELKADPNGKGVLEGKIKNNWDKGFPDIQVQAIIYDKYGNEIEIGNTYPMGILEPDEIQDFKISLDHLLPYIYDFKLTPLTTFIVSSPIKFSKEELEETAPVEIELLDNEFKQEREIFDRINEIRISKGLNKLNWNQDLAVAAGEHLQYMIDNNYYCHVSPDGKVTVETFARKYGIRQSIAENLAGYVYDKMEVVDDWMDSPGHRFNLLYPGHLEGAVAIKKVTSGEYVGANYVAFNAIGTGLWDYSVYVEGFKKGLTCDQVADNINAQVAQRY